MLKVATGMDKNREIENIVEALSRMRNRIAHNRDTIEDYQKLQEILTILGISYNMLEEKLHENKFNGYSDFLEIKRRPPYTFQNKLNTQAFIGTLNGIINALIKLLQKQKDSISGDQLELA